MGRRRAAVDSVYCGEIDVMLALASAASLTTRFSNVGPPLRRNCENEQQRCAISESYLLTEHLKPQYPKDGPTWMKTLEVQHVFV